MIIWSATSVGTKIWEIFSQYTSRSSWLQANFCFHYCSKPITKMVHLKKTKNYCITKCLMLANLKLNWNTFLVPTPHSLHGSCHVVILSHLNRIQFTTLETGISLCIYAPLWHQNYLELLSLWKRLIPPYFWIWFSDLDQPYICTILSMSFWCE